MIYIYVHSKADEMASLI